MPVTPVLGDSARPDADFSDLRAMFLSCTLKRSPEPMYGGSGELNEAGQYAYYGRVGPTTASPTATPRS